MMWRVVVLGRIVYTDGFLISEALDVSAFRHVRVDHAAGTMLRMVLKTASRYACG